MEEALVTSTTKVRARVAAAAIFLAPIALPAHPASGAPAGNHCTFGFGSTCYWYVVTQQTFDGPGAQGAYAKVTQHSVWVESDGDHSLAEIAIANKSISQAIEVGWVVWWREYGDYQPHLFIKPTNGHQADTQKCWHKDFGNLPRAEVEKQCGWVQKSTHWKPNNTTLHTGDNPEQFGIVYNRADGNWWVNYANEWIGYFKGSYWGGAFKSGYRTQWYGEAEDSFAGLSVKTPCSDMGNGKPGSNPGSARFADMGVVNSQGKQEVARAGVLEVTDDRYYKIGGISSRTGPFHSFTYGGPGGC